MSEEQSGKRRKTTPLSWFEWLLVISLPCLLILVLLPGVHAAQNVYLRPQCQNNLKQMGLIFKMYSGEAKGERYPLLSAIPENWVPDPNALCPDYLTDLNVMMCPGHPDAATHRFTLRDTREHPGAKAGSQHPECISSRYYVYLGFSVADDYDALCLHDVLTQGDWGSRRDADIQSALPYALDQLGTSGGSVVMWDRVSLEPNSMAHSPLGANVLFLDGHAEFRPFNPEAVEPDFPVTSVSAELFGRVSPYLSPDCAP